MIGQTFENTVGQKYEVIAREGQSNSGNIKWRIRFIKTGYETVVEKVQINRGKIKDKYEPSVFGRGYMGDAKMSSNKKMYNIWYNMMDRCYNPNSKSFNSYGAKGVHVDVRWYSFEQFMKDIPLVDGYDEELFYANKLVLDKDLKQPRVATKIYSPETCTLVSFEENNDCRDNEHRKHTFIAVSPAGQVYTAKGIKEFAREHDLIYQGIRHCLTGKTKTHMGWTFKYEE